MKMCAFVWTIIILSVWPSEVRGFPYGAPFSTCDNNVPHHHGTDPTWSPTPYKLTRNASTYSPGDVILVTLSSDVKNQQFKGFQVVAKPVTGDTTLIVGTFIDPPGGAKVQKWYSRQNTTNCITHTNNEGKESVTVKWKAPATSVGDIVFWAGVVQEFRTFWTNLSTPFVRASVPDSRNDAVEPLDDFKPTLNVNECGETKGCLFWPKSCSYASCQVVVSYKTVGQFVDFEVMGDSEEYIAIGFSRDLTMGDDEVFNCIHTPDVRAIQRAYNPKKYNHVHRLDGIRNMQLKRDGNRVYCRFRRPVVWSLWNGDKKVTFDLNQDFYLQVAYGKMYSRTSSSHKHSALPLVSQSKVDFQSTAIVKGQRLYRQLQAHAFLTLTAWLLLAGVAKLMPSVLKAQLKQVVLGAGLWFQLHRVIATFIAVFTVVAIILMFVHLKAFTTAGYTHAICGLVVTFMMILQILAGILRPDKDASMRPLWYKLHFFLGHGTHLMAAVTALLAANIKLFDGQFQTALTAVFACWLVEQLLWDIAIVIYRLWQEKKTGVLYPVGDSKKLEIQDAPEATPSRVTTFLAAGYLACLLAFYIAALYFIFSW